MGSFGKSAWQSISVEVAEQVMESIQWVHEVSRVFRLVCKEWKFAHDQSLKVLSACFVHTDLDMPGYGRIPDQIHTRFPALTTIVNLESSDHGMRRICGFTRLNDLTVFLRFGKRRAVTDAAFDQLSRLTALTRLELQVCVIENLSPLSGLTGLTVLTLKCCAQIPDEGFSSLQRLTSLTRLDLAWTKIANLCPLERLNGLTDLDFSGCDKVYDFSPLQRLSGLTRIDLHGFRVVSLDPLSELTALKNLSLSNPKHEYDLTYVRTDFSALQWLTALTRLDLGGSKIVNLDPLAYLTALTFLCMTDCANVSSLRPLVGITSLLSLEVNYTLASELRTLSSLSALTSLNFMDCGRGGSSPTEYGCTMVGDILVDHTIVGYCIGDRYESHTLEPHSPEHRILNAHFGNFSKSRRLSTLMWILEWDT
jgi:Leucine-rich repeat (LRR) protein